MSFTGTRIRVAPRIVAGQYAKNRADLYLQKKFFEGLLAKVSNKEAGVLPLAMEVPGRLNEIRKVGKDAGSQWIALSNMTKNPKVHYIAALERAVRQLRQRGDRARLEAYKALLSGKSNEELSQLLKQLEAIGASIVKKAKQLREDRRDKRNDDDDDREGILDAVRGIFDANGDGFISEDEIEDVIGDLEIFLQAGDDPDELDDDPDENFGDDDDEFDDADAEANFDDDYEHQEVGRGGRGGGGGGRGGRGGGFRGGRGGRGGFRHRHGHYHGGYWGPTIVPYYSDWDLPEDDIVDTPDGPILLRRRPIVVRRILR